ncbi:MAG: hypothetical protein E7195_04565 [Peptococcaceae bacterium]|nr:hypothetical protein [Peptococcaceae bacterium]MBR2627422.1 hypothetical protein [Peptococcaceae bacterium]
MILTNPDEQVWNMLTGGAGSTEGRKELDKLKQLLKAKDIFFVVDHDDRYHWIRFRSRRDMQIIQIKADVLAKGDAALLELRYAGNIHDSLHAEEALELILGYYLPEV